MQMKKIITVVLTLLFIATTSIAYAQRQGQQYGNTVNDQTSQVSNGKADDSKSSGKTDDSRGSGKADDSKGSGKADDSKGNGKVDDSKGAKEQWRMEVQERNVLIKQNNNELNRLRNEVKNKVKLVKEIIKQVKAKPTGITDEKAAQIREKLTLIRNDNMQLGKTKGKLEVEAKKLRLQKNNKNFEGALENYSNISAIQEQRIDSLRKLNADLDVLIETLK